MPNVLTPNAKQAFLDNNGKPLVGGRLFTYAAGTSTKLATTVSAAGANNANPIVLDYRGECNVWIPPNVAYKFVLAPPGSDDPPTQPIWTVDAIVSSQLITLYGGVDTGSVNAYVLTFTSNFSAYTDGTVIYWVPSNANTGASTLNVNGLGAINIVNQNGATLTAGQLIANQVAVVLYKAGSFLLISSGLASQSSQTVFSAQRSIGAGDVTLTNNAVTNVVFDTEIVDQGANYNNATGVFTAPVGGVYTFYARILVRSNGSAGQLSGTYFFSKNDSVLALDFRLVGLFEQQAVGLLVAANSYGFIQGSAVLPLVAGDTIRIKASQPNNGGGAFTLVANANQNIFTGYKCG